MVTKHHECPSHLQTVHLKMAKMGKFVFCIFYHHLKKKYILQLEYYAIGIRLSLDESFIKQEYSNSLHLLRNRETVMPSLQYERDFKSLCCRKALNAFLGLQKYSFMLIFQGNTKIGRSSWIIGWSPWNQKKSSRPLSPWFSQWTERGRSGSQSDVMGEKLDRLLLAKVIHINI